MRPDQVVARAKSAVGHHTVYSLGQGGTNPATPYPAAEGHCDCSGYAAWCLGIPRQQPNTIGWIETTRIVQDATGDQKLFEKVSKASPGDLVVYGDTGGHEGHVGVVVATLNGRPTRVCHCTGRKGLSDAIINEPASVFWTGAIATRGAIFARLKSVEENDMTKTRVEINGKSQDGYYDAEKGINYLPLTNVELKEFITSHGGSFSWNPASNPPKLTLKLPK
jgi:hypothetical protein